MTTEVKQQWLVCEASNKTDFHKTTANSKENHSF